MSKGHQATLTHAQLEGGWFQPVLTRSARNWTQLTPNSWGTIQGSIVLFRLCDVWRRCMTLIGEGKWSGFDESLPLVCKTIERKAVGRENVHPFRDQNNRGGLSLVVLSQQYFQPWLWTQGCSPGQGGQSSWIWGSREGDWPWASPPGQHPFRAGQRLRGNGNLVLGERVARCGEGQGRGHRRQGRAVCGHGSPLLVITGPRAELPVWYRSFPLAIYFTHGHVYVLSRFSCVWLFAILWTVAHQAPLCMEFLMKEYWSGLLFASAGDFSDSGIEPMSPA